MKTIQLPAVGKEGGWANHLIHYLVGRVLADKCGAALETPPWIGQKLFKLYDPPITNPVPAIKPKDVGKPFDGVIALPPFFSLPHRIVDPCFKRSLVQKTFQWRIPRVPLVGSLPKVIHRRRGDFAKHGFPWVTTECLFEEAHNVCDRPRGFVFVSDDSPHQKQIADDPDFLEDFLIMVHAKNLFVYPRSTFSQMAGLLGNGQIWFPTFYTMGKTGVKFFKADPEKDCWFQDRNNELP